MAGATKLTSNRVPATPSRPGATRPGATMRAIVQDEYGTADILRVAEIDRPVIGPTEVLVEVRAAGLDRGTWHLMAGLPYAVRLAFGLRAPKQPVPGLDVGPANWKAMSAFQALGLLPVGGGVGVVAAAHSVAVADGAVGAVG